MSERDLRLLRVLDAVLEQGSVTRAALQLGITQSAVSHSLRELRTRMGDALVIPTGTGLRPTPLALSLQGELRVALASLERLLLHPPGFEPASSTRAFSIAMPDYMHDVMVPDLLTRLGSVAPGVDIRVRPVRPGLSRDLLTGELDLVFSAAAAEQMLDLDRDTMRVVVASEPLCCVLRRGHPALAGPLDLDAYTAFPHVLVNHADRDSGLVDGALAALGRHRRIAVTLPSFPAAMRIVASSDLVATVPRALAVRAAAQELVELRPPPLDLPRIEMCLWWHPRFQHDPGHAWWRHMVAAALPTH